MGDEVKPGVKIGLALGSGAARGIAHIGVIKALHEAEIPIHFVAGTSMGALVGAGYAIDGKIENLEEIALKSNLRKLSSLLDPQFRIFTSTGFLRGNKIENFLKSILGEKDFSNLVIPFSAVATDINTGNEVVINNGSLLQAVRASISIPAIFVPVSYKGMYLVDGGTTNPVPANVVRSMGANFTIAVNVLTDPKKCKHPDVGNVKPLKAPSLYNTLTQSLYIMQYEIIRASFFKADVIIEPDASNIQPFEFFKGYDAIDAGYHAAIKVIPEIKKLLSIL